MSKLSFSTHSDQGIARRRNGSYLFKLSLTLVALLVTIFSVWPVSAAVELNYFSVVPSSSAILLEWSTAKEYNIIAFQVMCKKVGELDTAYHPIVTKSSKGSPSEGMTYDHLVASGLTPGVPYCFRLKEITVNGEPGQIFDRCGYGLSITPTPTLEPRFLDETATAQVFAMATEAAEALLLPTIDPRVLTLTPQPSLVANGTPDLIQTQQAIFAQQTTQAVAAATVQQQMFEATAAANALGIPATQTAIALTMTPNANPAGDIPATPQAPISPLPPGTGAVVPDTNAAGVPQSPEVSAQQTQQAEILIANQTAQALQTEQAIQTQQASQSSQQAPVDPALQATQTAQAMQAAGQIDPALQAAQTEQAIQAAASQMDPALQATQTEQAIQAAAQVDPALQAAQTAQAVAAAQVDPVFQATQTAIAMQANGQVDAAQGGQPLVAPESPLDQANTGGVTAPGYPYVIVTAVPTATPAVAAATFTPLPTALPTTAPLLASILAPTPQNMMIGLLFLIFVTASGIGILGLISGVFYARSRSRRRDRYEY